LSVRGGLGKFRSHRHGALRIGLTRDAPRRLSLELAAARGDACYSPGYNTATRRM